MLDIPTATTTKGPRAGTRTPEQRQKFLTNKSAKEASLTTSPTTTSTSITPQTAAPPGATSITPTSAVGNPWMSYGEYFAGKPEEANASKYSMYNTNAAAGSPEAEQLNASFTDSPYQYRTEYNAYKEGLPLIYQDLINYGISPEMVASGQATSLLRGSTMEKIPTDPAEAMSIYGSTRGAAVGAPGGPTSASGPVPANLSGTGSSHTLDPNIINRMWR